MKLHLESWSEADLALIWVILSPAQTVVTGRCGANEGFAATYNIDLRCRRVQHRRLRAMVLFT